VSLETDCNLWITAAREDAKGNTILEDITFDLLSRQLADNYKQLPDWFKNLVPLSNLKAGTTLGIELD
jgi:hypothetical protein